MTQTSTTSSHNVFAIEVTPDVANERRVAPYETVGRITVGEFSEEFRMNLSYWGVPDYRRQWICALERLEDGPSAVSCLVSSITDPEDSNFIFCWPLYRSGGTVFVQNAIIFLDELREKFDPENPWLSVDPRCTVDEDGNRISEWSTGIDEVRFFLDMQRGN
ncbi:hypothetical protein [Streptomyces sp. NPDC053427]|uniref:hypothetical protein n=1 Tax=Streptomyces sp. NPDC053427 TaxID=3365701 RepID=UPI0037D5EA20